MTQEVPDFMKQYQVSVSSTTEGQGLLAAKEETATETVAVAEEDPGTGGTQAARRKR